MNLDHLIFQSKSERDKWSNQIDYYSQLSNLDEPIRIEIVRALNHLRSELGNGFLKSSNYRNPIYYHISNKSLTSIKWIIWLFQSLQSIKVNSTNYKVLIEKLKSSKTALNEGVPFINISNWLHDLNTIFEYEPVVKSTQNPDIKITLKIENVEIFIEVASLQTKENWNALPILVDYILEMVNSHGISYSGIIQRNLNMDEIKEAKAFVSKSIQICLENNEFTELTPEISNGYLHLAFSTLITNEKFNKWIVDKNYKINSIGAPFNTTQDLIDSIENRLEKKMRQIPLGFLGMVALYISPYYWYSLKLTEIINCINQKLNNHFNSNQIIGILLWSDQFEIVKESSCNKILNAHYFEHNLWQAYSRKLVYVENLKYESDKKISNYILSKIINNINK
jgi:hypothetical protein